MDWKREGKKSVGTDGRTTESGDSWTCAWLACIYIQHTDIHRIKIGPELALALRAIYQKALVRLLFPPSSVRFGVHIHFHPSIHPPPNQIYQYQYSQKSFKPPSSLNSRGPYSTVSIRKLPSAKLGPCHFSSATYPRLPLSFPGFRNGCSGK